MIDWHLADIFCCAKVLLWSFTFGIGGEIQTMHLCTSPKGNNKKIKYNQFSGISHSHKYAIEHMLEGPLKFQRMKNELKNFIKSKMFSF